MNAQLAAVIREQFEVVRDQWVQHLLSVEDSVYRERPHSELVETVERGLEAWVQVLEGREHALQAFVRSIVALRMDLGFPLSELHRACVGFRIVVTPLIEERYTDPVAAARACGDAAAVCDLGTLQISEEWQRLAIEKLADANRLNEERANGLDALNEENRRLAQALSGANSRLHAILRSVDSAILLVDTEARVVYANPRVRDLLGVDPESLIGRDKREVVASQLKAHFKHADAFEQRLLWLHEHMEEEAMDELEVVSPAPGWLKRYSAPVRDETGRLLGRITLYTDITEDRRTQELLEEMVFARTREIHELSQRLVQRERLAAIGELAASIAHELRNPLGVIANACYLLRRKLVSSGLEEALAASLSKTVETMDTHVRRCSRVISDLLDFARSRPLRVDTVDPCSLVRNILREHLIPRNIRVVTDITPEMPSFAGDEPFLEQALSNLIANALKAMEGSENGELRVSCHPVTGGVEIVVTDTGTGMTEEVRARMFEPLFTTSPGGTGLGLPLVKRIVEAHDGQISVATAPGQGTTLTLFLPFRAPDSGLTTETQSHREE